MLVNEYESSRLGLSASWYYLYTLKSSVLLFGLGHLLHCWFLKDLEVLQWDAESSFNILQPSHKRAPHPGPKFLQAACCLPPTLASWLSQFICLLLLLDADYLYFLNRKISPSPFPCQKNSLSIMMDGKQMENKSLQCQNSLSTRTKEKWVLVTQLCLTLCDPVDCSPPGSSVHGILQTKILELAAIPFSRRASQPRDWTQISCIAGRFFTTWATRKAQNTWKIYADIVFWHRYVLAFSKRGAMWVPSKHFSCD